MEGNAEGSVQERGERRVHRDNAQLAIEERHADRCARK